jgi:eukaryotic-like serine/threonine-protein kinase
MDHPPDPKLAEAHARVGSLIAGKWQLDQLIGVGGMAAVYAATHRNGHRVAIKVLHRLLSSDPEIRRRFLREGYAANRVEHPGTVKVHDDGFIEDGAVFLVMELLSGESLEARAERMGGGLEVAELLSIADQLLDVLAAAHAAEIVHRDIKPENVFMTTDGTIRVLDFGIARLREQTLGTTNTWAGVMMGTPAFMAPEQARGAWDEVDAQTDLWAVGATMFTLLSGEIVHQAATAQQMLVAAMIQPARSLAKVAPNRPQAVIQLVDRALAFNKKERWPDAKSMQRAVRAAHQAALGQPLVTASMLRTSGTAPPPTPADPLARTVRVDGPPSEHPNTVAPVSRPEGHPRRRHVARLGLYGVALLGGLVGTGLILRSQLMSRRAPGAEPPAGESGAQTAASSASATAEAPLVEPSGTEPIVSDVPGPSAGAGASPSAGPAGRPAGGSPPATVSPRGAHATAPTPAGTVEATGAAPTSHAPSGPTASPAKSAAPSAGPPAADPEALKDRRK